MQDLGSISSSSNSTSGDSYCAPALSVSPLPLSPSPLSPTTLPSSSPAIMPRQQRQAKKRVLAVSEDPTEALAEHVKKCRVSSTPGELRLKKDLEDCDLLHQQGVARFDKTPGNPLKCQLTFLRPIGDVGVATPAAAGTARGMRTVPTTFSIVVPKFYPHDPPAIFAERCFRRTCSFVGEDGQLHLPFLERAVWNSVSTMAFVVETLHQGLRKYATGEPQPWQIASEAEESDAAKPRTQHTEQEQHAAGLSATAAAAAAAAAAAGGACFASSGDLLPSLVASEGLRRYGGGGDEWAVEARWNVAQPSGGGGDGCGYGGGSGSGSGALSGASAVFGREEAVVGCGAAGASAWGWDGRAKPGWTRNISDGCMDVTDSL